MEPFDYMKALSGVWNLGGDAFLTAQQNIFRDMVKNMGSAPGDAKSDVATAAGLPKRSPFSRSATRALSLSLMPSLVPSLVPSKNVKKPENLPLVPFFRKKPLFRLTIGPHLRARKIS